MTGKDVKHIKSRWQFALGVTFATLVCLVSGWVVFHRLTTPAIDPSSIEPLASPHSDLKAPDQTTPVPGAQPVPTPTATQQAPLLANQQPTNQPSPGNVVLRQGVFRVGNPTSYPVRVVLLSQKTPASPSAPVGDRYEIPAHWDFSPEEGGVQGLLVSLPDRTLKLKKGDILVAFAQDGSGQYWGPYVVGETGLPTWNAKAAEWQLILPP